MRKIIYYLLLCLATFASTGSLLELYGPLGATTVLSLMLIGLSFFQRNYWEDFFGDRFFLIACVFAIYCGFLSVFSYFPQRAGVSAAMFFLYALIATAAYSIRLSGSRIQLLFLCASIGMAVVTILSVADFYGYIYVQSLNEVSRSITAVEGVFLEETGSLSGPYRSRTEFVSYMSLVFPIALWFSVLPKVPLIPRLLFVGSAAIIFIGIVLAGSRGMYLSVAFVALFYAYLNIKVMNLKFIVYSVITLCVILGVITFFAEGVFERLLAQFRTLAPDEVLYHSGDSLRFEIWKAALFDVLTFPIGKGFGSVETFPGTYINTHNIFIEWIHAGGIFGFILISYLIVRFYKCYKLIYCNANIIPLLSSLASFFIFNLTHAQWGVNLFWVILGLFLFQGKIGEDRQRSLGIPPGMAKKAFILRRGFDQ